MNGSGETADTNAQNEHQPCGITSFFPIGMSCRGRAEAFARRLQSKLRTLGSQDDDDDEETTLQSQSNGEVTEDTWATKTEDTNNVKNAQPLRLPSEAADAFFDFDLDEEEPESPGSPIDECEYTRLIETAGSTPQEPSGSGTLESGYVCASPCFSGEGSMESNKSTDDSQYFDPDTSDNTDSKQSTSTYYDCVDAAKVPESAKIPNGHVSAAILDSDSSMTESLPPSQSTDSNLTCTAISSTSCSTLQDVEGMIIEEMQEPVVEEPPAVEAVTTEEKCMRLPSIIETDEETEADEPPRRLRRSSSLKTGKTPPGTPGRKKIVRFADVLGLDLADVKMFLDHEVPKIPSSAYDDLDYKTEPEIHIKFGPPMEKMLLPLFQQPGGLPNFLDKVREKQVCLENAAVTDPVNLTITGTVRVRNLDFHKSVYVRYTLDSWKSYSDLQANYVDGSCDGFSDKFSFTLFGNSLRLGQRIEIAIRFHCKGQQFWDNNYDTNYCFQCLPTNHQTPPIRSEPMGIKHRRSLPDSVSGAFY